MKARVIALRVGYDKLRHVDSIFGAAQPDHESLGLGALRIGKCAHAKGIQLSIVSLCA